MENIKTITALILMFLSMQIILTACTNADVNGTLNGTLKGHISIGPLCPVERNPPDPNCMPTSKTYDAWPIIATGVGKAIRLNPDAGGNYSIQLPAGNYVVDLQNKNAIGSNSLPADITINSGKESFLDISIDTGIR